MPKITTAGASNALGQDPDWDPFGTGAGPEDQAPAALPEPPPVKAPKAEWVDHAEAVGLPREDAESMTKSDLVETVKSLEGGDDVSPGSSSSASSGSETKSSPGTPAAPPLRAPTTASPSGPPPTAPKPSSTVPPTAGSTRETGSGQSGPEG